MNESDVIYPARITKSGEKFIAYMVDCPDCKVVGDTYDEVVLNIKYAFEDELWHRVQQKKQLPPSSIGEIRAHGPKDSNIALIEVNKFYLELPRIVYLYYPANYHLPKMLLEPYLWFSDPAQFNDPFELPTVLVNEWTNAEKYIEIKYQYEKSDTDDTLKRDYKTPEELFAYLQLNNPDFINFIIQTKIQHMEDEAKKTHVACFSRIYDSFLMWSHYGRKHTGVVIGYDFSLLYKEIGEELGGDVDYRLHPTKMKAGEFAGALKPDNLELVHKYLNRKLLTKHPMWSYEREFRICSRKHKGAIPISNQCIKELHFGCQMEPNTKKILLAAMQESSAELYNMVKKEDYGLLREKIKF